MKLVTKQEKKKHTETTLSNSQSTNIPSIKLKDLG